MSENDKEIMVAYCGLICSECGMFKKGKCPGCYGDRPINRNCKIEKCNVDNDYQTCAECKKFPELQNCRKLNNVISKVMGLIFRTNRNANLYSIRDAGLEKFKSEKDT